MTSYDHRISFVVGFKFLILDSSFEALDVFGCPKGSQSSRAPVMGSAKGIPPTRHRPPGFVTSKGAPRDQASRGLAAQGFPAANHRVVGCRGGRAAQVVFHLLFLGAVQWMISRLGCPLCQGPKVGKSMKSVQKMVLWAQVGSQTLPLLSSFDYRNVVWTRVDYPGFQENTQTSPIFEGRG